MIVNDRLEFVCVAPPRTGSTVLHQWLSRLEGVEWQVDQWHHSSAVPPSCLEYFTFASIREPLDRTISLWGHYQACLHVHHGPSLSFREFVWLMADRREPTLPWFYRMSQITFIRGVRLDAVVRCNHLARDLRRLPFFADMDPSSFPPLPTEESVTARREAFKACYATSEIEDAVRTHFAEDLDLWAAWNVNRDNATE